MYFPFLSDKNWLPDMQTFDVLCIWNAFLHKLIIMELGSISFKNLEFWVRVVFKTICEDYLKYKVSLNCWDGWTRLYGFCFN